MKKHEHALDMETLMTLQFKEYQEEAKSLLKYYTKDEAVDRCTRTIERINILKENLKADEYEMEEKYADQMWYWHTVRYICGNWEGA